MLRNAVGVGGCQISLEKKVLRFNVFSVTMGWAGVEFLEQKCNVTLEWPQSSVNIIIN